MTNKACSNGPTPTDASDAAMTFWRNNRLDAEFTMAIAIVADLFMASQWNDPDGLLDRQLRAFLTDNSGPISAVWDNETHYNQLLQLIQSHRSR